jgi:hypothetical protein
MLVVAVLVPVLVLVPVPIATVTTFACAATGMTVKALILHSRFSFLWDSDPRLVSSSIAR